MYYRQVTEGYEDQARFAILQKVGMTKREIRKSINSQMLTVFFLPLITAGRAAAASAGQPLYASLNQGRGRVLPIPMMNILNGGAHADQTMWIFRNL